MTLKMSWQKFEKSQLKSVQLSNRDENSVAKGEIAHHEQFLLLPECFQKLFAAEASESVYMLESVNHYL